MVLPSLAILPNAFMYLDVCVCVCVCVCFGHEADHRAQRESYNVNTHPWLQNARTCCTKSCIHDAGYNNDALFGNLHAHGFLGAVLE